MAHDTSPIRPEERFDEALVAAYLKEHLRDLVGDHWIEFDQFPGGAANLTYRAIAGDTELVLRRAPLGPVAKGGHDMEREHRVLSRLWQAYPLAPRAYLYCADPRILGKPFFVMERRHGCVVRATWPEPYEKDPALKRQIAAGLVDALADLHLVDAEHVGLNDLGHPDGFVQRQIDGWARRWSAAKTREVPAMDAAMRVLQERLPEPQSVAVLHNDFKLDNAMVSTTGDMVAIFDWDMATRGDPLVDLGTLLAYWADPDSPTYPIFGERAVAIAPVMDKSLVVSRYAERTGHDVAAIAYYEGLALYRIAVIIEQIYARFVAGQTSDVRFARFEPIAPILASAAIDVLTAS